MENQKELRGLPKQKQTQVIKSGSLSNTGPDRRRLSEYRPPGKSISEVMLSIFCGLYPTDILALDVFKKHIVSKLENGSIVAVGIKLLVTK